MLADGASHLPFYRDGELFEVEAHVVPDTLARIDLDGIIPTGIDRFVEPVVEGRRMSRDAMETLAEAYFESSVDEQGLPPSVPGCRRPPARATEGPWRWCNPSRHLAA